MSLEQSKNIIVFILKERTAIHYKANCKKIISAAIFRGHLLPNLLYEAGYQPCVFAGPILNLAKYFGLVLDALFFQPLIFCQHLKFTK